MARARKKDAPAELLREFRLMLFSLQMTVFSASRVSTLLMEIIWGYIVAVGPRRVSNLLRVLGWRDRDWTRVYRLWSRERWREEGAFGWLQDAALRAVGGSSFVVVLLDSTRIYRSGLSFPGLSLAPGRGTVVFSRGLQWAQRFVIGSLLTPVVEGFSRAIPVSVLPAFAEGKNRKKKSAEGEEAVRGKRWWYCPEWEAGLRVIREILSRIAGLLLAVCDGAYNTVGFWRGLPERCVAMVRAAKNQALYELPEENGGRGRPRRYGARAPVPHAWLREREGWREDVFLVRGREVRLRYRVEGPFLRAGVPDRPLFLIVVRGYRGHGRKKSRDPRYFLVTAIRDESGRWVLPLEARDLLLLYWQRWEQEVVHRALKSEFGLGQPQCWSEAGSVGTVRWTVWLFGLLVLCAYRAWGVLGGPGTADRWYRRRGRWTYGRMLAAYREALLRGVEFQAGCMEFTHNLRKNPPDLELLERVVAAA